MLSLSSEALAYLEKLKILRQLILDGDAIVLEDVSEVAPLYVAETFEERQNILEKILADIYSLHTLVPPSSIAEKHKQLLALTDIWHKTAYDFFLREHSKKENEILGDRLSEINLAIKKYWVTIGKFLK